MKEYVSNVEDSRVAEEELVSTKGQHINPEQIWRDGSFIPSSPDYLSFTEFRDAKGDTGTYFFRKAFIFDGSKEIPVVEHIKGLKLVRVPGTLNSFRSNRLIDLIGSEFNEDAREAFYEDSFEEQPIATVIAPESESLKKRRKWEFVLSDEDGTEFAYGIGDPIVDSAAGVLTFRSKDFVESIKDKEAVYIDFYRYIGRKGFFGSDLGIDLPFRDDLTLLKSASDENKTASFELAGESRHTVYVLPNNLGVYVPSQPDKGVVMLQENYNEIDWNIGHHNGGHFRDDGTITKS